MTAEDPNAYWANHPPEWEDPEENDEFYCGICEHYKRRRRNGRYVHYCEIHRWEVSNADYCDAYEPKE